MRFLILFLAAFLAVSTVQLNAQEELSKEEKKKWKDLAKQYKKDPAALKQLTEDKMAYQQEALEAKSQLSTVQTQLNQQKEQLAAAQQQNAQLNNQLAMAQQQIDQLNNQVDQLTSMPPTTSNPEVPAENFNTGVVYRIQVGAYSPGKVPAKFSGLPDVTIEDAGNVQKVLFGNYRNYDEAKSRQRSLRGEGYKSAWIVPYKDGRRVSLREARGY